MNPTTPCPACGTEVGHVRIRITRDVSYPWHGRFRMFRCTPCGAEFASPRQGLDYDRAYSREGAYGQLEADQSFLRADEILRGGSRGVYRPSIAGFQLLRRLRPDGSVLDFGYGNGAFLVACAKRGHAVHGIEASPQAEGHLRRILPAARTLGSLEEAIAAGIQVDVVCAFEVLEHLPDPLETLRRLARLLLPGGMLLGSVPNRSRLYWRWAEIGANGLADEGLFWDAPPHHLTRFTARALRRLLARGGFGLTCVEPAPLNAEALLYDGLGLTLPPSPAPVERFARALARLLPETGRQLLFAAQREEGDRRPVQPSDLRWALEWVADRYANLPWRTWKPLLPRNPFRRRDRLGAASPGTPGGACP